MRRFFSVSLISLLFVTEISVPLGVSDQGYYVWWEGENPVETNFPKSTWFSTGAISQTKDRLSNQQWLTNEGERTGPESYARYKVPIPESGDYDLWVRKFWKHGPFRWRFGDQEWRIVGRDVALADDVSLAQFVGVNWVSIGPVSLDQGEIEFEIRLLADQGESLTAGFDCFLLTRLPFVPRGKLKPDEKSGLSDEGFFSWEPDLDLFEDSAVLDLRFLNEEFAGLHGFVKRDGERFLLGDGIPVKFWAVNASSEIAGLNRGSIQYLARKLAKFGVNMIRFHSPLFDSSNVERLDPKRLDNLMFFIEAMKQEGIYTSLSFYFPLWFDIRPEYGIEGYDATDNKRPFALLYFNERMQEIYQSWLRELLTTQSPYSETTLANEPAVAMIEIVNEDSFFFWTFTKSNVPAIHWQRLETMFGEWLAGRYGSLQEAYFAWGNIKENGDNLNQGRMALYEAWHMTGGAIQQSSAAKVKRVGDQVRFLTELQRNFYTRIKQFIQQELGSNSLVSASNWHVSDPVMLDALERYTYTAGDVIDRHGYFNPEHNSMDGSHAYAVRVDHTFKNVSALTVPQTLPLQFVQVNDFPQIISEIGWTNPNLYRADYSFLAASYGSLQGVDGIYAFALGGAFWDTSIKKFALSSPVILGNFPAYALLYRRGDIEETEPVVHQVVSLQDLYEMKGSGALTAQALDDIRMRDVPPGASVSGTVNSIDPLSFYVGKVVREFGDSVDQSREINFQGYIDRENHVIRGYNDRLVWDYQQGIATINAPRCQGAAGFLKNAGGIRLDDVSIESNNDYGTIVAISLDGNSLSESKSILIQAMTVERPYGFKTSGLQDGTILNLGSYPFGVELVDMTLTFRLDKSHRIEAIALDENGYKTSRPVQVDHDFLGEQIQIRLNDRSIYHVLQRETSNSLDEWMMH